ncbi:hypothetical protein PS861_02471 [Pseudomonas fluorescens]|nr:hypothetical protein PS861_02471 [Pseudomonas fluorescens]
MQFWRRSIQWQLILSMGTALLVSILIVVGIYTLVVNRLAQSYLVEQALPSSIEAMRNDIERILVQPLTAAKDIASNSMVRDWLAGGEDSAQAGTFTTYLEGVRAEHKAFTAIIVGTASNHYFTEKAWIGPSVVPIRKTPGSTPFSTATSRAPSISTMTRRPENWRFSSTSKSSRPVKSWVLPGLA